ncbi:hypothetical protein CPHO_05240 [Corynebacterium phocae]|uniref:DUF3099 domain-containing protein n=1 Tax=Corynebacterium phocae TaxID=161895 RepID=A0A1L7D2Q5_9CORY|nr:DUF3099 domain-containing protein [Corynebacterium phocae]APT92398.1 hypothetical protein CPHO_05240 [Corynebacterium phocae]
MKGKRKPHLITDAKVGPGQDRHRREVEYLVLQGLRIPPLILCSIFVYYHWWVAAAIVAGITIPLPWIAVVLGNSKGQVRDERERMAYRPGMARQQMQDLERQQLQQQKLAQLPAPLPSTIDHTEHEHGSDKETP